MLDHPTSGANSMAYALAGNIGIARAASRWGVLAQPLSAWFLYGPVDVEATQEGRDIGSVNEILGIREGFRTNCPVG